jgi:predicted nucleic acid-binding protein
LACERQANLILIDERAGRDTARGVGIEPRGTLGILIWAGASGHLDFETAIRDLITRTRFRFTPDVIDNARRQYEALRRDLHNRSNGSGREP